MKRNNIYKLLIIAVLMIAVLSGCKKDTVTIRARISHYNGSKTSVECGSKVYMNGSSPRWNNGDTLRINENAVVISSSDGLTASMEVPTAGAYKAVYPSSIAQSLVNGNVANLTLPRMQIYREDDTQNQIVATPMCAASTNCTLSFKNMGALLAINLTNETSHESITVDSVSVKSVAYGSTAETPAAAIAMWGDAVAEDISSDSPTYTLTATPTAGSNDSVTLARGDGQGLGIVLANSNSGTQNKLVYVYIPAVSSAVNNLFSIRIFATDAAGTHYTYLRVQTGAYSGNLGRNQKADVPFEMNATIEREVASNTVPEGALSGIFSVGNRKQVYFSQGNLQYRRNSSLGDPATGLWRFAENQWDYLGGEIYRNYSDFHNVWFDLFGWGTSGYNSHKPEETSSSNNTYAPSMEGGDNANYDWGVYNAISNGGNQAGLWRTLTAAEWDYLTSGRTFNGDSGEGHCCQILKVNDVLGLLIYPDDFTQQDGYSTASNLNDVPEGCAFLPMAGYREVREVSQLGSYGRYWSSTVNGSNTSNAYVMRFGFNSSNRLRVFPVTDIEKRIGCSVRLVQNVPSSKK